MYGVHSFRGWNYDLRDDFIGSKVMLAFAFSLRNDIEPFKRKLALTLWSLESDFGRIGDQHRSYGGRTNELRGPIITQNGVVSVVTLNHQVFAGFVFGQQPMTVAKIPASWPLAKIPA